MHEHILWTHLSCYHIFWPTLTIPSPLLNISQHYLAHLPTRLYQQLLPRLGIVSHHCAGDSHRCHAVAVPRPLGIFWDLPVHCPGEFERPNSTWWVSTHLKNHSQSGSFPQVGVKFHIFETTTYKCSFMVVRNPWYILYYPKRQSDFMGVDVQVLPCFREGVLRVHKDLSITNTACTVLTSFVNSAMNLKLVLIPETDDHQTSETSTVWFYKYPKQKDLLNSQWWKKGGNYIPGKENWPWSAENILSWHPYHAKWRPNQEMSPTLNMAKLRKSRKQSRLWTSRDLNTKLRREKNQHPKNLEKTHQKSPICLHIQ